MKRVAGQGFALALVTLLIAVACPAEDPAGAFDYLFGQEYKQAKAAANKVEQVKLAEKIRDSLKTANLEPNTLAYACEKIDELAGRTEAGCGLTLAAYDIFFSRYPQKRGDCLPKIVAIRQAQYAIGKPEKKVELASVLVSCMAELADARLAAKDFEGGAAYYRQAIAAASSASLRSSALKGRLERATALNAAGRQVAQAKAQFQADSNDPGARQRLIMLLVREMDDPVEAARYVAENDEGDTGRRVRLAAQGLAGLAPTPSLDLADWYFGLSQNGPESTRIAVLRRAMGYYQRFLALHAEDDMASTRAKVRLQQIQTDLNKMPGGDSGDIDLAPVAGADPAANAAKQPGLAGGIDLLALADPNRDAVVGKWIRVPGKGVKSALIGASGDAGNLLQIPAGPEGEYELCMRVSRSRGPTAVMIGLPIGQNCVSLMLGGSDGNVCGLGHIQGIKYLVNETTTRRKVFAEANAPSTVLVRVAGVGNQAEITVFLNGERLLGWRGQPRYLSPDPAYKASPLHQFSIGVFRGEALFESLEVRMLNGSLRKTVK